MSDTPFTVTNICGIFRSSDKKGKSIAVRHRRSACFIITLSGKIRFTFESGSYETHSEKALFIPADASYQNDCLETADSLVFNFQVEATEPISLTAPPKHSTLAAFEKMNGAFPGESISDRSILMSEIYALAAILFAKRTEKPAEKIMQDAIKYMYDAYQNPEISIRAVANSVHISDIYLYKLFRKKYSETPFQYLTKIRMEQAAFLLQNGIPISEIAQMVGYSSIYSFSRAYKRFFGVSPSKEQLDRENESIRKTP